MRLRVLHGREDGMMYYSDGSFLSSPTARWVLGAVDSKESVALLASRLRVVSLVDVSVLMQGIRHRI